MTAAISILLPARGRPTHLRRSVASLFELASSTNDLEIIVRLDDDDPQLREEIRILRDFPKSLDIHVYVSKRVGYANMHTMYNGCAECARGDWLFLWNDDIEMKTSGWDHLLREAPSFSIQFPRRDVTATTDYTLPAVGRPVYEAIGHLSINAFCDAWISDISAFAGTSVIRDDIEFVHHRLQDETLAGQNDGGREWARFKNEQTAARRSDMEKIMSAPGWSERFAGWKTEPIDHIGVDYINLAAGERKAGAVRLNGRR